MAKRPGNARKAKTTVRSKARAAKRATTRGSTRRQAPKRSGTPRRSRAGGRRVVVKAPKRASPAPAGVKVRRPAVHVPAPIEADVGGQPFTVQIQKAGSTVPLDPATGLPAVAPAAFPGHPRPGSLTYAGSGVDIHKEDKAIEALAGMVNFARTGFGAPMGKIGHFAGLVDFGPEHALVLCTDGVGSKVEIANALKKWDTVGIDCMAMNVNDAICVGAEPLAFVDYLAIESPDPEFTRQIGVGLNEGARQGNCSLIGGETASLPGIIKGFDLAGTCMAFVKKSDIVDGSKIVPGDAIIGLASTGIHSNGYSLARRCFESGGHDYTAPWPWADKEHKGRRVGDVLLEPTRIYVREIMALLRSGIPIHGLSHITGSGLRKLRRINGNVQFQITDPLPVPSVFQRVQELGQVEDHEMYKTFNMGMGFAVVVPKAAAKKAVELLRSLVKYEVKVVGKVAEGTGVVHPVGGTH